MDRPKFVISNTEDLKEEKGLISAEKEYKFLPLPKDVRPNISTDVYLPESEKARLTPFQKTLYSPDQILAARARNQSWYEQVGLATVNFVPNVLFGLGEMAGLVGELGYYALSEMTGQEYVADFSNALTETMIGWKDPAGKIYREDPTDVFDWSDPAWWITNISSLFQSIAEFGITGFGVGSLAKAGVGAGVKAMQAGIKSAAIGRAIGKGGDVAATAITAASLGYLEGGKTGAPVFNEVFNTKFAETGDYELAIKEASEAAATTVKTNTALIGALSTAAITPYMFRKGATNMAMRFNIGMKPGESMPQYLKRLSEFQGSLPEENFFVRNRMAFEAVQEAAEEVGNLYAEEKGYQKAGMSEYEETGLPLFLKLAKTEEGILSMALGAMGGVGQTALLDRMPWYKRKDKDGNVVKRSAKQLQDEEYANMGIQYAQAISKDLQETLDLYDQLQNNISEENEAEVELIKEKLFDVYSKRSMFFDDGDSAKAFLTQLSNVDNTKELQEVYAEQIEQLEEAKQDATVEQATEIDKQIEQLQQKITEDTGKTMAMKMGLAENKEDNSYKEKAKRKINEINDLVEEYKDIKNTYNYGDEVTAGLADYVFFLGMTERRLQDNIDSRQAKYSDYEKRIEESSDKRNTEEFGLISSLIKTAVDLKAVNQEIDEKKKELDNIKENSSLLQTKYNQKTDKDVQAAIRSMLLELETKKTELDQTRNDQEKELTDFFLEEGGEGITQEAVDKRIEKAKEEYYSNLFEEDMLVKLKKGINKDTKLLNYTRKTRNEVTTRKGRKDFVNKVLKSQEEYSEKLLEIASEGIVKKEKAKIKENISKSRRKDPKKSVSDEEARKVAESGEVSTTVLKKIADKLYFNEPLNENEKAIRKKYQTQINNFSKFSATPERQQEKKERKEYSDLILADIKRRGEDLGGVDADGNRVSDEDFENGNFVDYATFNPDGEVKETYKRATSIVSQIDEETELLRTAQKFGNNIDEFTRLFFEKGDITNDELGGYTFATYSDLKSFRDGLRELKERFDKNGETVYSEGLKLIAESGFAGTVDIITIDEAGNFRIYDMKSIRNYSKTISPVTKDGKAGKPVNKYDFKGYWDQDRKVYVEDASYDSLRDKHQKQLSLYNIALENTYGLSAVETFVIPIETYYEEQDDTLSKMELKSLIPIDIVSFVDKYSLQNQGLQFDLNSFKEKFFSEDVTESSDSVHGSLSGNVYDKKATSSFKIQYGAVREFAVMEGGRRESISNLREEINDFESGLTDFTSMNLMLVPAVDYSGPYNKDGETVQTTYSALRKEGTDNVPIKIVNKDDPSQVLGYLPTINWVSRKVEGAYLNMAEGTEDDSFDVEGEIRNLSDLRRKVIENYESETPTDGIEVEITEITGGSPIVNYKTDNGKIDGDVVIENGSALLSFRKAYELLPEKELEFGIVNNGNIQIGFTRRGERVMAKDKDGRIINTSYGSGSVVVNIEGSYIPLKIGSIPDRVRDTIFESIFAVLDNNTKIIEAIDDANPELEIENLSGLYNFISQYVMVKPFDTTSLIENPDRTFINASRGNVYIGNNNTILTNDESKIGSTVNGVTYADISLDKERTRQFIGSLSNKVDLKKGLNSKDFYNEIVIKDGEVSVSKDQTYNDFIKEGLETYLNGTNYVEYEVNGETKRKYIYFEQPAVYFNVKESKAKPEITSEPSEITQGSSVKVNTPAGLRDNLTGTVESIEGTNAKVRLSNGKLRPVSLRNLETIQKPEITASEETEPSEITGPIIDIFSNVEEEFGATIQPQGENNRDLKGFPRLQQGPLTKEQEKLLEGNTIGDFTSSQQREINLAIVYIIKKYIDQQKEQGLIPNYNDAFITAKNSFAQGAILRRQEGKDEAADILQSVVDDHWNDFKRLAESYLNSIGYKKTFVESLDSEESDFEKRKFESSFDVDQKETANSYVKMQLSFIPNYEVIYDEDNNPTSRVVTNFIGLPSFVSIDSIWNKIREELMDVKKDMKSIIKALSNSADPSFVRISNLLEEDKDFENNFFVAFNMQRITKLTAFIDKTEKGIRLYQSQTDYNDEVRSTVNKFSEEMMVNSPLVYEDESGNYVFNIEKVKELKEDYYSKVKDKMLTGNQMFEYFSDLMKNFGVNLSKEDLKTYINKRSYFGKNIEYQTSVRETNTFVNQLFDIILGEQVTDSETEVEQDNSYALRSPILSSRLKRDFRELAKAVIRRDGSKYSGSHLNINGDIIYPWQKPNYLYDKLTALESDEYQNQLEEGVITKYSKFKNEKLDLFYVDGLKNRNSFFGKEMHTLDPIDLHLINMVYFFGRAAQTNGKRAMFVYPKADKNVVPVFDVPMKKYTFRERDKVTQENGEIRISGLSSSVVSDLLNYAMAEYERITVAEEQRNAGLLKKDKKYYEGSKHFFMFPFLNYDYLRQYVDDGIISESEFRIMYPSKNTMSSNRDAVETVIKKVVERYFINEVNRTADLLSSYGLLGNRINQVVAGEEYSYIENIFIGDNYLKNRKLSSKANDEENILDAVLNFVVNNAVAEAEHMILFGKDPAFYWKNSVDETLKVYEKRAAKDIAPRSPGNSKEKQTTIRRAVSNDIMKAISEEGLPDAYSRGIIDIGDGSQFSTVRFRIDFLEDIGKIKPEKAEELRKKIKPGRYYEFTDGEVEKYFSPLKDIYTGEKFDKDLKAFVPIYVKNATFVLLPQAMKLPNGQVSKMDAVRIMMENSNNQIDLIAMNSASKVGTNKILSLFDSNGKVRNDISQQEIIESVEILDKKYYGLQQEESDKKTDKINIITQLDTLLFSGIRNIENFNYKGQTFTGRDLENHKDAILREIYTQQKEIIFRDFGISIVEGAPIITNFTKLKEVLIRSAEDNKWSKQNVDALRLSEDKQSFIVPQELTAKFQTVQNLLLANLSKVVKVKLNGYGFVQAPELLISSSEARFVEVQETETEPEPTPELVEERSMEDQVVELFETNSELANKVYSALPNISKKEVIKLYAEYLSTIFPDSKVKDIVYRSQAEKGDTNRIHVGKYFSISREYSEVYGKTYNVPVKEFLVNITNPKNLYVPHKKSIKFTENTIDGRELDFQNLSEEDIDFLKNKNYNGVIVTEEEFRELNIKETVGKEIIVFEPEQIHILGNKQDIEGFKDFAGITEDIPVTKGKIIHTPTGRKGITSGEVDADTVTVTFDNGDVENIAKSELELDAGQEVTTQLSVKEDPNQTEFNKLPSRSETPTMTYAGIGSRQTPENVLSEMTEVAEYLESLGYTLNTGVTFRGKEEGADAAFSRGTTNKNLFSPENQGSREKEQTIAKEIHPAPSRLKQGGLKLMARNTNQIFGNNLDTPVDFVLFWAEETKDPLRPKGGTGQAVEMARRKGIPTINMSDPNWREKLDSVLGSQVSEETQPSVEKPSVKINTAKWTEDSPKENPDTAYVFTENINSIGDTRTGGGTAVIRNNPNAIGIVTKKYYVYREQRNTEESQRIKEEYQGSGQWYNQNFEDTDADFELFKQVNEEQFAKIDAYSSVIFPDGFANSLAKIPTRFAEWLQNELLNRYGLVTELNESKTGLISKEVISGEEETQQKQEITARIAPETTEDFPLEVYVDGSDIKGTGAIGFGVNTTIEDSDYAISGAFDISDLSKLENDLGITIEGAPSNGAMEFYGSLVAIRNTPVGEYIKINQDLEAVQMWILSGLIQDIAGKQDLSERGYKSWWRGLTNEEKINLYNQANEIVKIDSRLANKHLYNDPVSKGFYAKDPVIKAIQKKIIPLLRTRNVQYKWVRGHSGIEGNERVDAIAKSRDNYNNYSKVFGAVQNITTTAAAPSLSPRDTISVDYMTDDMASGLVFSKNYDPNTGLRYVRKENGEVKSAQVLVPWNFKDSSGKVLDINNFIVDGRIDFEKLPQEVLEGIASRIPNQGHSSMLPIEIVGFVPQSFGKTVIVPDGITLQMGSDFDIDKLYSYLPNYYYDNATGSIKVLTIESSFSDPEALYEEMFGSFKNRELFNEIKNTIIEYNEDSSVDKNIEKYLHEKFKNRLPSKQLAIITEIIKDQELSPGYIDTNINERIPNRNKFYSKFTENESSEWIYQMLPSKILRQLYFEIHKSVLTNPEVFDKIVDPLENNDIETEKELIGKKSGKIKKIPESPLSYVSKVNSIIDKWAGASLVGISAIGLTTNSIVEDKEIKFVDSTLKEPAKYTINFKVGNKLYKFDRISGEGSSKYNGQVRTKQDNLKAFVTTAVDNANVNQAGFVNFNPYTAGVAIVMAMMQDGSGNALAMDSILRFLSQDVINSYIDNISKASWSGNSDFIKNKHKEAIKETERNLLINYLIDVGGAKDIEGIENASYDEILNPEKPSNIPKQARLDLKDFLDTLKKEAVPNQETLLKMINGKDSFGDLKEYYKNQLIVIKYFDLMNNISKDLIPVRKALLNPFVDQLPTNVYDTMELIENVDSIISGGKYLSNIHTLIGKKVSKDTVLLETKAAFVLEGIVFPSMSIINSAFPVFGKLLGKIETYYLYSIQKDYSQISGATKKKLWNEVVSYIWQNTEKFGLGKINDRRLYLLYELPKKLVRAQSTLWGQNNLFLRKLDTEISTDKKKPSLIKYQASRSAEISDQDIATAVISLIKSSDPEQRELIQDLYEYAMITGATFNPNGFMHVLPSAWFEEEFTGIFNNIREISNNINVDDYENMTHQIVRNRTELIPSLPEYSRLVASKKITVQRDEETGVISNVILPSPTSENAVESLVKDDKDVRYVTIFKIEDKDGKEVIFQKVQEDNFMTVFRRVSKMGYGNISEYNPEKIMPNSFFNEPNQALENYYSELKAPTTTTDSVESTNNQYAIDLSSAYLPPNMSNEDAIQNSLDAISQNEYYKDLAKIMKEAMRGRGVKIQEDSTLPSYGGYSANTNTFYYSLKLIGQDRLDNAAFEKLLLHEYGHAITDELIAKYLDDSKRDELTNDQKSLIRSLKAVYEKVKTELTKGNEQEFERFVAKVNRALQGEEELNLLEGQYNWYAISSFKEFTAAVWDERFQVVLNDIEYDSNRSFKDRVVDILNKLIRSLSNVFNIEVKEKTALREALSIVIDLTTDIPSDVANQSNIRYTEEGNRIFDNPAEAMRQMMQGRRGRDISGAPRQSPSIVGVIKQTEQTLRDIQTAMAGTKNQKEWVRLDGLRSLYEEKLRKINSIENPDDLVAFADGQLDFAREILGRENATYKEYLIAFNIIDSWDFDITRDFLPTDMQSEENAWFKALSIAGTKRDRVESSAINKLRIIIAKTINNKFDLPKKLKPSDLAVMKDIPAYFAIFDASVSGSPLLQYLNRVLRDKQNRANSELQIVADQISSKIRELGFTAGDFDFMFQKNENGELTGRIIHEYTAEYDEKMSKMYSDLYIQFRKANKYSDEKAKDIIRKAVKEFHKKRNEINEFIDVRFYFDSNYSNNNYSGVKEYEQYLRDEYGSERAEIFIETAKEKAEEYKKDRNLFIQNMNAEIGTLPIEVIYDHIEGETKDEYISRKIKRWEEENSPAVALMRNEKNILYQDIETQTAKNKKAQKEYITNKGDSYLLMVPRMTVKGTKTNFYNDAFYNMNDKQKEWLEFFSSFILRMKQHFPITVQNSIPENFYPQIMKDTAKELLRNDFGKFMDKEVIQRLTSGTVSFEEITSSSSKLENKRFNRSNKLGETRYLIKYVDTENKLDPNDLSQNVELVMKRFAEMAIFYKHKNDVEAEALIINRILQSADEIDLDGNIIPRSKSLTNIKKQADHMIKSGVYDRKSDESKPSKFVMFEGWNILDNNKKRRRLKEIKNEYLELERKLVAREIEPAEYKLQLEILETEYNNLSGKPLVFSKVLQTFLELNQLKHMGWNFRAGFANMGFGMLSVFTWAAGNREFNTNNAVSALGILMRSATKRNDFRVANIIKKMNVLFEVRDVTFGRGNSQLETDIRRLKFFTKLISAYQVQRSTEYFVQGLSTIAQMLNYEIDVVRKDNGKTETIPLFYAFNENGDWNTELYEKQDEWDYIEGQKMSNFRNRVIKTNYYMHGNYDPDNMPPIKRNVYLRALFQFRSWVPYGFGQRFMSEYYDYDLGRSFKGRYRTFADIGFGQSFKSMFSLMFRSKESAEQKLEGDNISKDDIANLKMNLKELQILAGLVFFGFLLRSAMPEDDEDDEMLRGTMQIFINQLYRIEQDIYFYVSPRTLEDILRNPVPVFRLFIDYINALQASIDYLSNPAEYERDHPLKKFAKANPGANQYVNMMYSATNSYRDK